MSSAATRGKSVQQESSPPAPVLISSKSACLHARRVDDGLITFLGGYAF